MGILKYITELDQFGAFFQLSIQGDNPQYKSLMGAIATFFINSSSLTYFGYLFFIWITDQSVPSMASQSVFLKDGNTYYINSLLFAFNVEVYDNETLENYSGKNIYKISTKHFLDGDIFEEQEYKSNCTKSYVMDLFEPQCSDLENKYQKKLSQNYKEHRFDDYLGFMFYPCDDSDPNCLGSEKTQELLDNLNGDGKLTIYTQTFDLEEKELNTIPQDYYFPLNYAQDYILNLQITVTHLRIMKGIFFTEETSFEYVSNIDIKPTPNLRAADDPYIRIWISLDRSQIEQQIEYPKLTQILAQFSSLFSGLMAFGIIFNIINGRILRNRLIKNIGDLYFHNFDQFQTNQQNRNFFQNKKFQKYKNIRKELAQKCNFLNILYEISKVQFALQTFLSRKQLFLIQKLKYTITEEVEFQQENSQFQEYLNEDDFLIFQLNSKSDKYKEILLEDEITISQNRINGIIRANISQNDAHLLYNEKQEIENIENEQFATSNTQRPLQNFTVQTKEITDHGKNQK